VESFERFVQWLTEPIFQSTDWTLTPLSLLKLTALPVLILFLAKLLRRLIAARLQKRGTMDRGMQHAIATITSYVFIVVGLYAVISDAGIDMTSLAVFGGALGLGVGLGMQETARNFVSGLVLLVARPLRPGDRIQLGDLEGDVREIRAYSTMVVTQDDASVILPNSDLLQNQLINWTLTGERRRIKVPVGVHYDSDPIRVRDVLLEVARENAHVLDSPEAEVRLVGFGESSVDFELVVWTSSMVFFPKRLISDLNYAIFAKLSQAKITIPYPQRDLHVKSSHLESLR